MRDTRTRLARAVRFFAKPEVFTLECPHCGIIYRCHSQRSTPYWDPRIARFSCRGKKGCRKQYVIGLLAWPVATGGQQPATTTPRDQVPSPRQLAQLRKEGQGWWLGDEDKQRFTRVDETNLTLEQDRPHAEGYDELEEED